jgi:hypothetical protein
MATWWSALSTPNQAFFVAAIFFSTLFIWQLVSSLAAVGDGHVDMHNGDASAGMHADGHVDVQHVDVGAHAEAAAHGYAAHDQADQHDAAGLQTFRLLSIRSILAFGTLFSWAGALYLQRDATSWVAMLRAVLWGLAGMVIVALFFWVLPRLSEEGTATLQTAVGRTGQVYLNIPAEGVGQVRVLVGNTIKFVKARAHDGQPLAAGAEVRVVALLDSVTVLVEAVNPGI